MIWYLTRPIFSNYRFWSPEEVMHLVEVNYCLGVITFFYKIGSIKSNTKHYILLSLNRSWHIREHNREEVKPEVKYLWFCWHTFYLFAESIKNCLVILKWMSWCEPIVNFPILKFMEVIMEVVDLRFQIVFLIRIDDDIKMLHAKFQPSMTIFRTKCSLYKMWCH